MAELLSGTHTSEHESMGCLPSVLISFLSAPFSSLFVFLNRRLHRAQHSSPNPAADQRRTASDDPVARPLREASLGVTRYESSASSSAAVECVFCLCSVEEGEEVRELRCRHLFHQRCLDRWLAQRGATCPLCRDPLVPHEAAAGKRGGGEEEEEEEEEREEFGDLALLLLANYAPWHVGMVNWY